MVRVLYHWLRKLWSSTNVHFMYRNTIVKIGLQVSLLPYMHRVILLRNWRYTLYLAIPTLCSFADGVFYSHNLFALWLWLAICLITPGKRSKVTIWKVNSRLQSRGKLSQMNDEHHDELCVILLYTFCIHSLYPFARKWRITYKRDLLRSDHGEKATIFSCAAPSYVWNYAQ